MTAAWSGKRQYLGGCRAASSRRLAQDRGVITIVARGEVEADPRGHGVLVDGVLGLPDDRIGLPQVAVGVADDRGDGVLHYVVLGEVEPGAVVVGGPDVVDGRGRRHP